LEGLPPERLEALAHAALVLLGFRDVPLERGDQHGIAGDLRGCLHLREGLLLDRVRVGEVLEGLLVDRSWGHLQSSRITAAHGSRTTLIAPSSFFWNIS
jgi:hypothetical protein